MGSSSQPVLSPAATALDALAFELWQRSGGEQYGLTSSDFVRVLDTIARKYLAGGGGDRELRDLCRSLKAEELALAQACAAGNERAWDVFLTRYREKLYETALSITREESRGRELADSIYADLFGTSTRDGQRVSKLASYTGRGSLEGWLRTVLAQEYVNRYRRIKRLVSLEEESEEGAQFRAAEPEPVVVPADNRLAEATDDALTSLSPQDCMVLSAYYLDERTLAEIARMLGVHESTISRKLDKLAKALRKQILGNLVRRGMSRRQAEESMDVDVRDLQVNIKRTLTQESSPPAFSEKTVEARVREGEG